MLWGSFLWVDSHECFGACPKAGRAGHNSWVCGLGEFLPCGSRIGSNSPPSHYITIIIIFCRTIKTQPETEACNPFNYTYLYLTVKFIHTVLFSTFNPHHQHFISGLTSKKKWVKWCILYYIIFQLSTYILSSFKFNAYSVPAVTSHKWRRSVQQRKANAGIRSYTLYSNKYRPFL